MSAPSSSCRAFPSASIRFRTGCASSCRRQALGRLTLARIRHGHFYGLRPEFRESWHVRKGEAGGGALLDEGVHAADLLAWLFGVPEHVVAHVSHAALGLEVEDVGVAVFSWPSGLVGRSHVELHVRRRGYVDRALRHRRQPARVRRGPRVTRYHRGGIRPALSNRSRTQALGNRRCGAALQARRVPPAECAGVRRRAHARPAAADHDRRRDWRPAA